MKSTARWSPVHFLLAAIGVLVFAGLLVLFVVSAIRHPSAAKSLVNSVATSIATVVASSSRPDHVVIVLEENHNYSQIIGNPCCAYINAEAAKGALMTNSHGLAHPSEPNYLALFSGANQGVTNDSCPHTFSAPNLGQALIAAGLTFGTYSEDLPSVGSTVCKTAKYVRRHNPVANFSNVPPQDNMPWESFPTDFTQLPTVSIVVPNLCNDMHDCSRDTADAWLQHNLDGYAQWAMTHNSLLIITFDEDSGTSANKIATIFVGPMVRAGKYDEAINHLNILRTVEDIYNLPHIGESVSATSIRDIWLPGSVTMSHKP